MPGAHVVKAIPPFAELLAANDPDIDGRAPVVFVCGDDIAASDRVRGLVGDIGADAIDADPLSIARDTSWRGIWQDDLERFKDCTLHSCHQDVFAGTAANRPTRIRAFFHVVEEGAAETAP